MGHRNGLSQHASVVVIREGNDSLAASCRLLVIPSIVHLLDLSRHHGSEGSVPIMGRHTVHGSHMNAGANEAGVDCTDAESILRSFGTVRHALMAIRYEILRSQYCRHGRTP